MSPSAFSTRFVLFGSTGDLAKRKLLPALHNLSQSKNALFDEIICVGRRDIGTIEYREMMGINEKDLHGISYHQADLNDLSSLKTTDQEVRTIWYLALPRSSYNTVIHSLSKEGMVNEKDLILVEKPIGIDTTSVTLFVDHVEKSGLSRHVQYVDHYRGKGILMALQTQEGREVMGALSYPVNASISFSETLDVAERADTFDESGIVRDVVQNHLLQFLGYALCNTEKERIELFTSLEISLSNADITSWIRGQYRGYNDHDGVSENSETETFAYISFPIEDPIVVKSLTIEAGKNLDHSEVKGKFSDGSSKVLLTVQPLQRISINKKEIELSTPFSTKDAYEVLLSAAFEHNKDFFVSAEELIASWKVTDKIIAGLKKIPLSFYLPHSSVTTLKKSYENK